MAEVKEREASPRAILEVGIKVVLVRGQILLDIGVLARRGTVERNIRDRWEVVTESEEQTEALGAALGRCLEAGDVVGMVGELGAGKTAMVRGVALGAGVPDGCPVNSPTFTIMNLYDAPGLGLCHLDLYRLGTMDEWEGVGVPELLTGGRALLVEWADRFPDALPKETLWVEFKLGLSDTRTLLCTAYGDESAELLGQWREEFARASS